jgi:saccharopine dehydrogenase (NAD+, L-glutamate forming)
MLAESGMALALDDIPDRAGQLSPVAAMGDALLVRLQNAGMTIRVVD